MSATRLLVLGVVRMHGKAHGYQVRRDLLTWSADKWANVAPGSIYHALKQMTKEQLLEQVEVGPGAAGPERTAYQLTPDGEAEFQVLLARFIAEPSSEAAAVPNFPAAFTFLPALARKRAISLLRHRIVELTGQRASMQSLVEDGGDWGQPAHINEIYRLWLAFLDASLRWTEELVERLEAGEYVMADDTEAGPVIIVVEDDATNQV